MLIARFVLALIAVPLLGLAAARPWEDNKPKTTCLTKVAVQVKNGVYDFRYDSWVKPNEDNTRFYFGRCILAERKPMWVKWEKTDIEGWTDEDGVVRNGVQAPHNVQKETKSNLWYGAAPAKTEAPFVDVGAAKNQQGAANGSLRSFVRMGLAPKPQNDEQEKATKPTQVDVEFEANAFYLGGKRYLYVVTWRDRQEKADLKGIRLRWPEQGVVGLALRAKEGPEMQFVSDEVTSLSGSQQGVRLTSFEPPTHTVTRVAFVNDRGQEIGAAPVSVYSPAK